MERINITALRHSAFYTPLLITISGGFLKAEGLEADYTPASPERSVSDLLRSGTAHLSQSAVATSFADLEQGKAIDIVHFAQINRLDGFLLAGREPDPGFHWRQLEGKQVLVDHLFQPLAMFRYALHRLGIDESQVTIIDAGSVEEMDRAFRDGRGDYIHQQGPAPQQLEHDGIGYPVAAVGRVIGPVAFSSLCASRAWLQTDMARAFMCAYRKGRAFVVEAPAAEIAATVSEFFPVIDRPVLERTIDDYKRLGCWTLNPAISRESYERLLDVFLFDGLISRRHAYERCVVAPPDS